MENYTKESIKTICKNSSGHPEDNVEETIVEIQNILNLVNIGVYHENICMFFVNNNKIYTAYTTSCSPQITSNVYDELENGQYMRIKISCKNEKHFVGVYDKLKEKFHKIIHSNNNILFVIKL